MTAALFEAWFERCLLPALSRKSVIILDNALFHRMKVLQEIAELSGHIIWWCPEKCAGLNLFGMIDCPKSNIKRFNMIKH